MYLWSTYPLMCLLERTWEYHILPVLRKLYPEGQVINPRSQSQLSVSRISAVPPPQYVELLAIGERCLNFALTGAARCLAHGLMKRTWTSRALIDGFLPMFWDGLIFGGSRSDTPHIRLEHWPVEGVQLVPRVASKRAQELTYGTSHFLVRTLTSPSLPMAHRSIVRATALISTSKQPWRSRHRGPGVTTSESPQSLSSSKSFPTSS